MLRLLEEKEEERPSIGDFINRPRAIAAIQEKDEQFYEQKMSHVTIIIKETVEILKSYTPPSGAFERMKFRAY